MLATLLVRANEVVSVDGLIDELWGEEPPRTAMTTLQVYISQLRKLLRTAEQGAMATNGTRAPDVRPPDAGPLETRSPGYLLHVEPAQLDLAVFDELHTGGREALERGDAETAADLQRRALALWRGPMLSDTPHGSLLNSMAVRLAEVRVVAQEQRVRAELLLGRHQQLLGELQSLTAELPLHEEFHAHLMVALYRTGRQADALRTFGKLRRTLVDELAIEPGRRLQQLHSRILTGDPSLLRAPAARERTTVRTAPRPPAAPTTAPPAPARPSGATPTTPQPPPLDSLFTGRTTELSRLGAWLGTPADGGGCVQLTGAAGVGKTALAVAAAHRTRSAFPDGAALLRLRSGDGTPLEPAQILAALLRRYGTGTGTGEPPPGDEPGLRAAVGALLRGRRMLLILDDATSAAQVRPLIAAAPDCRTLLTCRTGLPGLGGRVLHLDALSPEDARALLRRAAGPGAFDGTGERGTQGARGEQGGRHERSDGTDGLDGTGGPGDRDADAHTHAEAHVHAYAHDEPGRDSAREPQSEPNPDPAPDPAPAPGPALKDGTAELVDLCGRLPHPVRAAAARLAARPHWSAADLAARMRDEASRLAELRAGDEECGVALRAVYDAAPPRERRAAHLLSLLPAGAFGVPAAAAALGVRADAAERALEALVATGLLATHPEPRDHDHHHDRHHDDRHHGHYHFPDPYRLVVAERRDAVESPIWVRAAVARLTALAADETETARHAPHVNGEHALTWFSAREAALRGTLEQAHRAGLWQQTVRLADAMTVFLEALARWHTWEHTHTLALDAADRLGDPAARARMLRSLGDLAWQRGDADTARTRYENAVAAAESAPAERSRALAGLADLHLDAGACTEAAALVSPTLERPAEDLRGRYETHRVLALAALRAGERDAARDHIETCLSLTAPLKDRRLESYARRWLNRLHAEAPDAPDAPTPTGGGTTTGWLEIRPGVWHWEPEPTGPGTPLTST
ncbi:BTAD domain-containing putative transcriptional regulator [Streptomyces sp. NPDC002851]